MTLFLRPFQRLAGQFLRAGLLLGLSSAGVHAQAPTPTRANWQRASRTELAAHLAVIEPQASAGAGSKEKQLALKTEVEDLRARLANGDFRVGDRFALTLTIDSVHSDTVSIRDGLLVSISNLPDFSLKALLRSELDDALNAYVSRYLKNARIRTVMLTQVSILGAVARPGFYWIAPDRPISDVIMIAGGPTAGPAGDENLREIEIKSAYRVIMNSKESRVALMEGRTIEQADIRTGDEVRIPAKRKVNWQAAIQLMFVASSLFFAFTQFIQWYYNRQE